MLVVLPEPFTPTISTTVSMRGSSILVGVGSASSLTSSSFSAACTSSTRLMCSRSTRARSRSTTARAVLIPRSAWIRISSSSSQVSSVISLAWNSVLMRPKKPCRVLARLAWIFAWSSACCWGVLRNKPIRSLRACDKNPSRGEAGVAVIDIGDIIHGPLTNRAIFAACPPLPPWSAATRAPRVARPVDPC